MEGEGRMRVTRGMLPLLGLHVVNEYYRLERKPPVTAGLLLANTLIYLRPAFLHDILPTLNQVWFNPHLIVKVASANYTSNRDLKRFFLSAFYHMNESHLVYNMLSLLWKGIQLETSMGSMEFAAMVAELVAMSQGITLLLAKSLHVFFDYDRAYYYEHAVGFSGVLFAMKVVLNSRSSDYTYVHGLIVPARYAAWAELILIQLFVPGVSFLGHLGGILAGLLYLRWKRSFTGSDPVTTVIGNIFGLFSWPLKFVRNLFRFQRRRRITGRGTVGGNRAGRNLQGLWRCPACTFDNSVLLSACEMCGTERERNGLLFIQPSNDNLSLEELRRRRLERFGR
ncbi:Rhomboid-like protein 14, mitochondrial [Asimina triloba]